MLQRQTDLEEEEGAEVPAGQGSHGLHRLALVLALCDPGIESREDAVLELRGQVCPERRVVRRRECRTR